MADLFGDYADELAGRGAWDEVFEAPDTPRGHYCGLLDSLRLLTRDEIAKRTARLDRSFQNAGITFDHDGTEHAWPLDLIPRLLSPAEWDVIERGVIQRVKALEAFLSDIHGAREALADRVVPEDMIIGDPPFRDMARGVAPAGGVRVHVAGIDLVRDEQGKFRVLEDNVRVPSGVSYALENRHAMTKVFPEAFATYRVRAVADYAVELLDALRASAPAGVDDPTVVLLTPGVYNSAYFEHALLARQMGIDLVEGRDLVVHDDRLYMRTTAGDKAVDVVYRRVDDEWLDPRWFRPESRVGCPGILDVARAGRVTIANAVGNGVADDKLVYSYVPDLIRYYLGEKPVLDNVRTFRLADPDHRAYVLDRLDTLVIKPVEGSGGKGIVIGPQATDANPDLVRRQIVANPRGWVAQPVVALSTAPTLADGAISPRHIDLRPFAINDGQQIRVLPGGLTRVALRRGGLIVNSSQGGGSKDTWVLTHEPQVVGQFSQWSQRKRPTTDTQGDGHGLLSRIAESLFWMGRYLERAEHTARLLDVHLQRVIDDPWVDERQATLALLEAMGLPAAESHDEHQVAERLGYDRENPSSVAGALAAARDNARGARDAVSSEFWECLNSTWLELPARINAVPRHGPHGFFRFVRQRTAMLTGLMDATLTRDDSRRFVELGWNLERVDMTARLLTSCLTVPAPASSWVSLLRACGAHEAFLRTYRRGADGPTVAEFLLLDRLFPRSAYSAMRTVERLLAEIESDDRTPARSHGGARRLAGRARTILEFQVVDEALGDVPELLTNLNRMCSQISDELTECYFVARA